MTLRFLILSLAMYLPAIESASAAVVIHELTGVVSFSSVSGVAVDDPFMTTLTYDTSQPDLEPADASHGRYGEFTLSFDAGPISARQTNPALFDFGIIDRPPGSQDDIVWFGAIGPGDIGLSAAATGDTFNSDALPLSLDINSFFAASVRYLATGDTRVDGTIMSISSRIVPEPSSLAILLIAIGGSPLRRRS